MFCYLSLWPLYNYSASWHVLCVSMWRSPILLEANVFRNFQCKTVWYLVKIYFVLFDVETNVWIYTFLRHFTEKHRCCASFIPISGIFSYSCCLLYQSTIIKLKFLSPWLRIAFILWPSGSSTSDPSTQLKIRSLQKYISLCSLLSNQTV